MNENKEIKIKAAKGRPMLTWVGKRPLTQVTAFPAQHIETFDPTGDLGKSKPEDVWSDWPSSYPKGGLLFHGDNKEVLAHLLANGFRGKVDLIYIDPPFDSGADYIRQVTLRNVPGTAKIDGEPYTLGEQIQYTDIWANDNYLQFMYERLLLLKELLSDTGNIFVHMDHHRVHYIKCILDEVFGTQNFINEIIWHKGREGGSSTSHSSNAAIPTEYQNILLYAKNRDNRYWNAPLGPYKESTLQNIKLDEKGWYYTRGRMGRIPAPWELEKGVSLKTYVSYDTSLTKEEVINTLTAPNTKAVPIGDIWNSDLITQSRKTDYRTEKPEDLLDIIINAGSPAEGIVLDCFIGSGTTAAVAQKLGRRWIGCDINKGAIQTTSKRLQSIIHEQIKALSKPMQKQLNIADNDKNTNVPPAQLSFTVWRVNDYDLAIQHNEAVNLACEYIGVERTRSDGFFDGTLGKRLVKIIPFGHPLTPLDLEEIKKELEARPEEDRNIVLVCLGKELAVDSWLEDWNRLRKGNDAVNRIEVIELRTDPKYGKFIVHSPASAKVDIQKENEKIKVKIEDFISPTIIERLEMDMQIFKAKITDWRSMVDCVMIDTAYDGKVFNVVLSDVPERKNDLVNGSYELPAPEGETMVAVKIIDMLGEEVLVVKKV